MKLRTWSHDHTEAEMSVHSWLYSEIKDFSPRPYHCGKMPSLSLTECSLHSHFSYNEGLISSPSSGDWTACQALSWALDQKWIHSTVPVLRVLGAQLRSRHTDSTPTQVQRPKGREGKIGRGGLWAGWTLEVEKALESSGWECKEQK